MNRPVAVVLAAAAALFAPAASALAQCTPHVSDLYGSSSLTGVATCSATFDDGSGSGPCLFVGGKFTISGVPNCALAKLVDGRWVRVPGITNQVNALSVIDDGSGPALYAAGNFALPITACQVAKWNGSTWTALPTLSTFGGVRAIAQYPQGPNGTIYVGGAVTPLIRLNGTTWQTIPNTISTTGSSSINTLKVLDDGSGPKLYIGGAFTAAGGLSAKGIATWDGTTCAPLGTGYGSGTFPPEVHSIVLHDDGSGPKIHISGVIDLPGRNRGNTQVAALVGNVWARVLSDENNGTPSQGSSALLSVTDDQGPALYVATGSLMESANQVRVLRNGAWSYVGTNFSGGTGPFGAVINALGTLATPNGTELLALGDFSANMNGTFSTPAIATLHNGFWQSPEARVTGLISAAYFFSDPQSSTGELFASRTFVHTPDGWASNQLPFPAFGGLRAHIDGDSRFIIWGYNRISMQSDQGWTDLPIPADFASGALAVADTGAGPELYAFHNQGGAGHVLSKLDQGAWTKLGSTLCPPTQSPSSLAVYDTGSGPRLYVSIGAPAGSTNLLTLDDGRWRPISAVDGPIYALSTFDLGDGPELVIAGTLSPSESTNYNGLARWNGSRVATIGSGLGADGKGRVLSTINTPTGPQLWAGGADGLAYAYWNGSSWTRPYALSTPAFVFYITPVHNPDGSTSIFLGGSFTQIAGVPSRNIAELITCPPSCSADFNSDGDTGTDADIEALFACLAGNCCPTCGTSDFNNDGDSGTDADIESFFRVLAGGPC